MDLPSRVLFARQESATPSSNAGAAQDVQNQSIKTFAASLSTAAAVFGIQIVAFLILSGNWKVRRSKETTEAKAARQSLFHKI